MNYENLIKQIYIPYKDDISFNKETILKCSNCKTELVSILVSRPQLEVQNIFQAQCWKCGDKSFQQLYNGGVHIAATKESCPADFVDKGEYILILTGENKAKDDGKI